MPRGSSLSGNSSLLQALSGLVPRMAAVATAGQNNYLLVHPVGRRGCSTQPFLTVLLVFSSLCVVCVLSSKDADVELGRVSSTLTPEVPHGWPFLTPSSVDSHVLPRLEGVQVGHKQEVELVPNKVHFMKTLSMKPLAFEIPDFLTDDECKILIYLATHGGLMESVTGFSKDRADYIEKLSVNQMEIFNYIDLNQDGQLQMFEMTTHERLANGYWLTPGDIQEMYSALKADPDGNGVLSWDEFKVVDMLDFYKYMDRKKANNSELVRNSKQAWLVPDKWTHPIIHSIQQRVINLTRLPADMIEFSESLQVVRYSEGGYYHAHYDSENRSEEYGCIHTDLSGYTDSNQFDGHTVCRYATVLLYLNNVTGGGETNFPIADNETYENLSLIQNNIDLRDMHRNCDKGNLLIKPVQGTAIFWYNHLPADEGWIGCLDDYSLHGGCLVTEGTKWIANQWINIDPNKDRQLLFQKQMAQFAKYRVQSVDKPYSDVHVEL